MKIFSVSHLESGFLSSPLLRACEKSRDEQRFDRPFRSSPATAIRLFFQLATCHTVQARFFPNTMGLHPPTHRFSSVTFSLCASPLDFSFTLARVGITCYRSIGTSLLTRGLVAHGLIENRTGNGGCVGSASLVTREDDGKGRPMGIIVALWKGCGRLGYKSITSVLWPAPI